MSNEAGEGAGRSRWALRGGAIAPIVYCAACLLAAWTYPGFRFASQPVSELGSRVAIDQAYPATFSVGVLATAIAVLLGAIGIVAALRRRDVHVAAWALVALTLILVAISTAVVGLFPWPDQRHGGPDPFGGPGWLASAFLLTPVVLAIAMWRLGDGLLRVCLAAGVALILALTAVRSGATGIQRGGEHEGLVQLSFALATYGPIGLCSAWLLGMGSNHTWRRLSAAAAVLVVMVIAASVLRARQALPTIDVPPAADGDVPDISAELERIRVRGGLPALSAAVFGPRGLIAIGASGVRKRGDTTPVTRTDRWRLWSDTKAMTAVLVGMYVDAGQLSWDATLPTLFPAVTRMDPAFSNVTLAQLLTHRSGVGEDPVLPPDAAYQYDYPGARELLADSSRTAPENRAALARLALEHAPYYAPGSRFQYSNWNYVLAASIVERLSGTSWEALMTTKLFSPLGMTGCGFGVPASDGAPAEPWDHVGDTPIAPGIHAAPQSDITTTYGPSSTVVCSLEEWGRFLALFFRDGRRDLISPATLARITTPIAPEGYAMGWFNGTQRGFDGRLLFHTGSNNQSMVTAWVDPARNRAYVVAANAVLPGTFDVTGATLARLARTFGGR